MYSNINDFSHDFRAKGANQRQRLQATMKLKKNFSITIITTLNAAMTITNMCIFVITLMITTAITKNMTKITMSITPIITMRMKLVMRTITTIITLIMSIGMTKSMKIKRKSTIMITTITTDNEANNDSNDSNDCDAAIMT